MNTPVIFDTEFTGLHQNTTLISIGLVALSGETFYAELTDYDQSQVDEWIQKNVIDNLLYNYVETPDNADEIMDNGADIIINNDMQSFRIKTNMKRLEEYLRLWFAQFDNVEMWADVLAYDWMLFCQIFGGAMKIPNNVFYSPFDIATLLKAKGFDPDIKREEFADIVNDPALRKHNALYDAIVGKECFMILTDKMLLLKKKLSQRVEFKIP